MCTPNFENADSLQNYATSKDGAAELAVGGNAISATIGGYAQTVGNNALIKAQQAAFLINADAYDLKARDTIERGRDQNAWLGVQGRMEQGRARNQLSYAGVDVNYGSAKSYLDSLKQVNEMDRYNTRYNAMNAAFGYQAAELNQRQLARNAKLSKTNPFVTALIAGGKTLYSGYKELSAAKEK